MWARQKQRTIKKGFFAPELKIYSPWVFWGLVWIHNLIEVLMHFDFWRQDCLMHWIFCEPTIEKNKRIVHFSSRGVSVSMCVYQHVIRLQLGLERFQLRCKITRGIKFLVSSNQKLSGKVCAVPKRKSKQLVST